jgi:hypothetical protein
MSVIGLDLEPDQLVLQQDCDFRWTFKNTDDAGAAVNYPAGSLYLQLYTGGETNARQRVTVSGATGGTYKLGLSGVQTTSINFYDVTVAPHDIGGDVKAALETCSNIGSGNVSVGSAKLYPVWEISLTINSGNNEKQKIALPVGTTGGAFRLGYGSNVTSDIAWNASAASVQTALQGLAGIGSGNASVSKLDSLTYLVEFIGAKAATDMDLISAYGTGVSFGITGGSSTDISMSTLVNGSSILTEPFVNTLNKTINDVFNTFETLLGVDIDVFITSATNVKLKVTGLNSYTESDALQWALNVTATTISGFLNQVAAFVGLSKTISISFYWNHVYDVEFKGTLANTPQPALVPDLSLLTGVTGKYIKVEVLEPGKAPITKWPFTISTSTASIKIESEEVNKIANRTRWHLIFLPSGEAAGGDPVARGRVTVQE